MLILLALMIQSGGSALQGAAERIAAHPELSRKFEERSAPIVPCGRKALERRIAIQAQGIPFEQMSQEQAGELFQRAITGAARDCEIDRYRAVIAGDIRAVLPDVDETTATKIAHASLIELIGSSLWGSEP